MSELMNQFLNEARFFLFVDLQEISFRFRLKELWKWPANKLFSSFNISRKKIVKLISKVNQKSVLNLYIFHLFPKNLDRIIIFNSVTLKNTQTEPQ